MKTKKPTDEECDVLIQQAGFNFQHGITGQRVRSTTQMLSVRELYQIVQHAFIAGQEHAENKHHKK